MLEYFEKFQIACGAILSKGEPLIDRVTERTPVGIRELFIDEIGLCLRSLLLKQQCNERQ